MKSRTATKDEKHWIDIICQFGCVVCFNLGFGYSPAGPHHLDGTTKPGCHFKTIPLCGAHHQTGGRGVAVHCGRVVWESVFGEQQTLLDQITEIVHYIQNRDKKLQ